MDVYRSKADGSQIYERGEVLDTPGRHDVDIALDLRPFEDGGWYWFDLTTADTELTLLEGGWHAPGAGTGRAAVAIECRRSTGRQTAWPRSARSVKTRWCWPRSPR